MSSSGENLVKKANVLRRWNYNTNGRRKNESKFFCSDLLMDRVAVVTGANGGIGRGIVW